MESIHGTEHEKKNLPRPAALPSSPQDAFRGLLEYFKALAGSVERELLKVPLSHQVNSADACFSVDLEAALFVLSEVGEVRDAWRGGRWRCSELIADKKTAKSG